MKLQISDDVVWRDLGEEVVMLNLATGIYFSLDGVGHRIWKLIAQQTAADEVVRSLVEEFDADAARIREDLDSLVYELEAEGLLAS
jgi:coenzyme PQQ synthesis protein D (PqqD)